ncbi:cytochrome b [Altererythrobacter fulvus]|uniref:cytochrome b n=1 Tax=Caenibius fulvus TaxID=2126012 RepID=UPI0030192AEC
MTEDESGSSGWSLPVILLHWVTGGLTLAVAGLAVFLLSPPEWSQFYIDRYMAWIGWHRLGGLAVLLLAAGWIALRRLKPRPPRTGGPHMQAAAILAQGLMLALLIALPVSGYLMDALINPALELPGGVSLPSPLPRHQTFSIALSYIHKWGGFALLGIAALHIAAALWHGLRPGDRTLRAMLPRSGKRK